MAISIRDLVAYSSIPKPVVVGISLSCAFHQ
jgi:hypothetical protein